MDWVDRPRNYKGLYGILQLLQGSHLDIFPQKTLKRLGVFQSTSQIGHYRNVRGLGKSMVVFRLFEKLRYSNERSTIF